MKTAVRRRKKQITLFDAFVFIFLLFILIITLYPFWYVLILSLNDSTDTLLGNLWLLPRKFTIAAYVAIITQEEFLSSLWISVARTVVGTPLTVLFTCMIGFVISRKYLVARKAISLFFLFTLYFGGGLIPFYMVLKTFHLIDTFAVYIVPGLLDVFSMLLVMTYMRTLPDEMEESAHMDGAGDWTIFTRIYLPLSMPIVATISLFTAIGHWNAWFDSYAYTYKQGLKTLSHYLMGVLTQYMTRTITSSTVTSSISQVSSNSVRTAITILSMIPIIMVYPFVQRYFIKGIMIGAVKA